MATVSAFANRNMTPTVENIQEAYARIKGEIHRTPVIECSSISEMVADNVELYFKCENLQKIGAFKIRGATNAVKKQMASENPPKSFVTHSSGNHAAALALAARKAGVKSFIVMPRDAPTVKVAAVKGYGAEVIFCEPNQAARESTCAEVAEREGAYFVHPYDNFDVVEGQGTLGVEMAEDLPSDVDIVIVPVGGGGLIGGTTIALKALKPGVIVIGAEPQNANDAYRSKIGGERVANAAPPKTIADGLKTNLGGLGWTVVKELVDEIIQVSEPAISVALRHVLERAKLVIEPSAAVGVAVALSEEFKSKYVANKTKEGKTLKVGIVLCGGNLEVDNLSALLAVANDKQ